MQLNLIFIQTLRGINEEGGRNALRRLKEGRTLGESQHQESHIHQDIRTQLFIGKNITNTTHEGSLLFLSDLPFLSLLFDFYFSLFFFEEKK